MLAWAILAFGSVALIVIGAMFRADRTTPWTRSWFALHRRADLPAPYRNLPIVAPILGGGLLTCLLVAAPLAIAGALPALGLPASAEFVLVFVAVAAFPVAAGVTLVAVSQPPAWLVPRWLVEADRRDQFVEPPPSRFDRAVRVVGFALLGIGVALSIYGVAGGLLGSG